MERQGNVIPYARQKRNPRIPFLLRKICCQEGRRGSIIREKIRTKREEGFWKRREAGLAGRGCGRREGRMEIEILAISKYGKRILENAKNFEDARIHSVYRKTINIRVGGDFFSGMRAFMMWRFLPPLHRKKSRECICRPRRC